MKVKTITCHEVYNHGASLQEFALLKHLQDLGHEAEAIAYKPDYLNNQFKFWKVGNPRYAGNPVTKLLYILAKLPERIRDMKRKKNFDAFSRKYIPSGANIYRTNKELLENPPLADAYICGSDQIWNPIFPNGSDPSFYLNFAPENKVRLSYAASFATDKLPDELREFMQSSIEKLDATSVRETSGLALLEDLGIEEGKQVLDPVFLLAGEYWKKEFVKPIEGDYILIYDFDSNEQIRRVARELASANGWRIKTVNKNITYAHDNHWLEGPDYFLSLVAQARMVLTNSFHAVCFSLIFERQLYVFDRGENINTRMQDLLSLVGLERLRISGNGDDSVEANPIPDFEEIRNALRRHSDRSKAFLKHALAQHRTSP